MKPSDRFSTKVWKKPPKADSKTFRVDKKAGMGSCTICKAKITSSKRQLARKNFHPAKSTIRTNRPYGGNVCNKCLRAEITKKIQEAD